MMERKCDECGIVGYHSDWCPFNNAKQVSKRCLKVYILNIVNLVI